MKRNALQVDDQLPCQPFQKTNITMATIGTYLCYTQAYQNFEKIDS